MSKKYHITFDGKINECHAQNGKCPYRTEEHFESIEKAQECMERLIHRASKQNTSVDLVKHNYSDDIFRAKNVDRNLPFYRGELNKIIKKDFEKWYKNKVQEMQSKHVGQIPSKEKMLEDLKMKVMNIAKKAQKDGMCKHKSGNFSARDKETGYVVIGDHQYFEGYTLFLAKEHVTELHHLKPSIKLRFLEEMSLVQEAVSIAFSAQKMNVELLGNGDAHAHWHIFPRREGDMKGHGLNGRGPVWWVPWEEMVAEEYHVKDRRLENLIATLSETLNQIVK